MIEQSIVHLPELVKDIERPVSIYLVHLSSSSGIISDHPSTGMHVINADGSGLARLTRTTAAELGMPDSLLLDDSDIESLFTYGTNVVGSAESGGQTVCSPDGKKLASVTITAPEATDSDSSAPPDDTDISVRTSSGTTDLGDPGYDYDKESTPIFSPDSRKLAFTKGEQIYVANADGSDHTQLVDKMLRYTAGPVFSPDSEKIAFVLYRIKYTPYTPSGHRDVKLPVRYDMYAVNVDGTGLTRLTQTEALEEKVIAWVGG